MKKLSEKEKERLNSEAYRDVLLGNEPRYCDNKYYERCCQFWKAIDPDEDY